jgi:hypothetical protein
MAGHGSGSRLSDGMHAPGALTTQSLHAARARDVAVARSPTAVGRRQGAPGEHRGGARKGGGLERTKEVG